MSTKITGSTFKEVLKSKLKGLRASLNNISQFVRYYKEGTTASQVNVRLERIDLLWEQISETSWEIELHEDYEEQESVEKEQLEFENRYYDAKSFLMEKAKKFQEESALYQPTRSADAASTYGTMDRVRLPQIKLQTFDGDIDDWLSFRDLYTSLIHEKEKLPDVEKFHYLKGCLAGEAKALVDPLKITSILDQVIEPAEYKDLLLVELLSSRPVTRRGWEEHTSTKEQDTLQDLQEFLQRRIQILESLPAKAELKNEPQQPKRKSFSPKFSCCNCKARHHTLLCFKGEGRSSRNGSPEKANSGNSGNRNDSSSDLKAVNAASVETASSNTAQLPTSQVLLATAVVVIEDSQGSRYPARALLNSGSECNFISKSLSQLMKVPSQKVDISILGIGQSGTRVKRKIQAVVKSRVSSYSRPMDFLVLPKVTACLPTSAVQENGWDTPADDELADPEFFRSRKVDLVMGIQAFFSFFPSGREVPLGTGLLVLTKSVFGWIVTGEVATSNHGARYSCNMSVSSNLEELMARFWSCEEVGAVSKLSPDETRCEEQFERTVERNSDGRYSVTLPKNDNVLAELGESRDIALRRLRAVEQQLKKDPNLQKQYLNFMTEYFKLGHIRRVDNNEEGTVKRCFLPHHPVIKKSSTTTKVRVVVDALCKTSSGISLNDALYAGPVVQQDLRSIVLRSRTRQVMVVADVEKMFRQIWTNLIDTPFQCVLWLGTDGSIVAYELLTVKYGTKSAPYLATRTLKQLASDEREQFPLAAPAVEEDVYMDDVISGADDVESPVELRRQIDAIMNSGGFKLRKWASNCPAVLEDIPKENLALPDSNGIDWDQDAEVKTLGLTWLPNVDCFKFSFTILPLTDDQILTKRQVLCFIARLFDPLGLLGATITAAKIFIQRHWCLKSEHGQCLQSYYL
ncbi:uncharacterized protein LOC135710421 [Ochlerotatus camptorhynchus]|uniref:uncharacterized protein LOC135710421 n=1 Tax=Ochlerotatus camptorhynchus TaxID=644619 RepID=UPI0031DEDECA